MSTPSRRYIDASFLLPPETRNGDNATTFMFTDEEVSVIEKMLYNSVVLTYRLPSRRRRQVRSKLFMILAEIVSELFCNGKISPEELVDGVNAKLEQEWLNGVI